MVFGGRLGVGDGICEARSLLAATSADRQQGSGSRDPSEPCTYVSACTRVQQEQGWFAFSRMQWLLLK